MKKIYLILIVFLLALILVFINLNKTISSEVLSNNDIHIEIPKTINNVDEEIKAEIESDKEWFYQKAPSDNGELEVYFLDVEQGGSTLIVNAGQTMLIDSGEKEYVDDIVIFLNEL